MLYCVLYLAQKQSSWLVLLNCCFQLFVGEAFAWSLLELNHVTYSTPACLTYTALVWHM